MQAEQSQRPVNPVDGARPALPGFHQMERSCLPQCRLSTSGWLPLSHLWRQAVSPTPGGSLFPEPSLTLPGSPRREHAFGSVSTSSTSQGPIVVVVWQLRYRDLIPANQARSSGTAHKPICNEFLRLRLTMAFSRISNQASSLESRT